ncbi:MAG: dUTP diphosphatase, partial [Tissierellia bacterium]|nr:dUTP diphosphatase [Tissierellia bacterium]
ECAKDTIVPSIWRAMLVNIGKFFMGLNDYEVIKPVLVPTGIKSYMQEDEALFLYNRSSNPLKKGLVLGNSVGVCDADFYSNISDDGHIRFQFYNFFPYDVEIKKGERIGQGIFKKFLKVDNDISENERQGGFGSTDTK